MCRNIVSMWRQIVSLIACVVCMATAMTSCTHWEAPTGEPQGAVVSDDESLLLQPLVQARF
jgi:hypothetical protein